MNLNGKIFEIGSGNGLRVYQLLKEGFTDITANEFSYEMAEYIRELYNVDVHSEDIRNIKNLKNNSFDFIVSSMVLEHVKDPVSFCNKVYDLLKPGGVFAFSVPNIDSVEAKLFGKHFYGLQPPYHISQFNEASISNLLTNFRDIKFYYQNFDRDWVVSSKRNYQYKRNLKSWLLNLASNKLIRRLFLRPFLFFYSSFGQTARVSVYAIKPKNKMYNEYLNLQRIRSAYDQSF